LEEVLRRLSVLAPNGSSAASLENGTISWCSDGEPTQTVPLSGFKDRVGLARAREMVLFGRQYTTEELLSLGIAQQALSRCLAKRCVEPSGRACPALGCHLDARLPLPDPEGVVTSTAVPAGCHQVPPRPEVAVDHRVRREEPLCLLA
jgi:hypothetical protein